MNTSFRPNHASAWSSTIIVLLAIAGNGEAATSAVAGTLLGNALNPGTLNTGSPEALPARDPDALDAERHRRSPSGLLLPWPELAATTGSATGGGWRWSGEAELGALVVTGDQFSAWSMQYKDLQTGPYLNNFLIRGQRPERARYFTAFGGAVGYEDQFYGLSTGRYNDWSLELSYNEIPHFFTGDYRSLWDGVGTGNLRLHPGLTPGNTPTVELQDSLMAIDAEDLSIVRHTGGLRFDKYLTDRWRFFGSYSKEHRDGARPFGAAIGWFGPVGLNNIEIPEAIDYDTHQIRGGLSYADDLSSLNLEVQLSMFRNNVDTLRFESPFRVTNLGTSFDSGTFDLYPDNDYYNLRAEYARNFPSLYNARFTSLVSWSRMKQDDKLIPSTEYSLIGGALNGVPTGNAWNTSASLSQDSAEAEIDSWLLDFGLSLRPTSKLGLRGKVRYRSLDNKSDYLACNPLTGQWGRLTLNGSGGGSIAFPDTVNGNNPLGTDPNAYDQVGCNLDAAIALGLVPAAGNVVIGSVPYEYARLNIELGGDYRLGRGQVLDARLMREEYHREHRERDKTWENSLKLGYTNRTFDFGTLRLHATYGQRRGDDYDLNVNDAYLSAVFGPAPFAAGTNVASWLRAPYGLRKFDIADRDQLELDGRFTWIARPDLNLGLGLNYDHSDYPNSDWGRTDSQRKLGANLDLNWQPSADLGLWAFYGYQRGQIKQHGAAPVMNSCVIGRNGVTAANWHSFCSEPSPINPLFPSNLTWDVESKERYHSIGAGLFYDFGPARLDLDYSFARGTSEIDYGYDPLGQAFTPDQLALVGNGMPDLKTTHHILDLSLLYPINKSLALRALYRYELGKIDDWHYAGVADNPVPAPTDVYLNNGPEDYHASVFGLFVQVGF